MYKVDWTPNENDLIVMSDSSIHLISQESSASIKEVQHPKRLNDFVVINGCLIVGGNISSQNSKLKVMMVSYTSGTISLKLISNLII